MRIEVIQEDIDRGKRHSCRKCPVALAVKRAGKTDVVVTAIVQFRENGSYFWWFPPRKVRQFIQAFDAGKPVEPFSFEME